MGNESSSYDFDTGFFNKYATPSNLLSRGAFGTVYGPIRKKDKQLAIKQIMFPDGKSADEIKKYIEGKQQIWNSLKHENLMRILSVDLSQLPKVLHIVMEFAAGGSLNETLRSLRSEQIKLPIDVVTDWTKQIADGMKYLHQKNIVHRDLKPSNILLMEPFDVHNSRKTITVKIADFDEVREYDQTTTMTFVGTCAYMAPEVLLTERFSKASDVWSFGVLIWEMLSGDIPHQGLQPSAIILKADKGELYGLSIAPSFPEDYKLILEKCWKSTCEDRLSFRQILEVLDPPGSTRMGASSSVSFDTDFIRKYATLEYCLSKGGFGNVFGPIKWNGMQLAMKQVLFAHGKRIIKNDIAEKEEIWNSLDHKHLMRILSVNLSQLPKGMYIVMKFAAGGSLNETLKSLGSKQTKLPIDVVTDWTKQIAEGMLYLHQKNIVHRDLKPSNILLMKPFDVRNPRKEITLKITDFDEVREHDHTTTMSFVGTYAYMAPEVLLKERFSKASDVWSFGVLIWELLSGDITHKGLEASAIIVKAVEGELDGLSIAPSFPEYYKLILKKCWKSTCEDRLSFRQILDVLDPPEIWDLTVLHQEVFILRFNRQDIEVYDSTEFQFKRRMKVDGMMDPRSIASCSVNYCLYIVDQTHQKLREAILRIEPSNGDVIKAWKFTGGWSQLSVASDTNVIACPVYGSELYEYTADGELVRAIVHGRNPVDITQSTNAVYAVKIDNGSFVICQYDPGEVYLMSTKETSSTLGRIDEVEILKKCSEESGDLIDSSWRPNYLSVNKEGSILVSDEFYDRVVLINYNFGEARILISKKDGMKSPGRTCFNESTGEWLVTDRRRIFVCRVEDEKIERKMHHFASR